MSSGQQGRPRAHRRARGDGAVSFLVVVPLVVAVFWMILQLAISNIAASAAQQTASAMARRLSDARADFALSGTGPAICEPLDQMRDRYGAFIARETVEVLGDSVHSAIAASSCAGEVTAVDSPGRECQNALDGVEVVVEVEAVAVLPSGAGLGLDPLDRLTKVRAASCAPARWTR